MKKLFASLLCFALLCSNSAYAYAPFEGRCFYGKKSLNFWVNHTDAVDSIIVGKVLEVKRKINEYQDDTCWARVSVNRWLKGAGDTDIWIGEQFNSDDKTAQGIRNMDYCTLKKGETHIVYGRYINASKYSKLPPKLIGTISNTGMTYGYYCAPNTRLHGAHPTKLDQKNADSLIRQVEELIIKPKGE